MAPPVLTADDRAAASARAVAARRIRSQLKTQLRSGGLTVAGLMQLVDGSDDLACAAGRLRVDEVLLSVPGFGRVRADRVLVAAGIVGHRRMRGLGERQRERLLQELSA